MVLLLFLHSAGEAIAMVISMVTQMLTGGFLKWRRIFWGENLKKSLVYLSRGLNDFNRCFSILTLIKEYCNRSVCTIIPI